MNLTYRQSALNIAFLGKLVRNRRKRLGRWLRRHMITPGVPPGIAVEEIHRICHEFQGVGAKRISHVHLAGWKLSGAYRLFITLANGRRWRLVYKNEAYNAREIPALKDLPVRPGPPEYQIYHHLQGELAEYLPAVYLCRELVPLRHFQYLLEDLSVEYERPNLMPNTSHGRDNLLAVIAELCAVHQALQEWQACADERYLVRYGPEFHSGLVRYAQRSLHRYVAHSADPVLRELLRRWPSLTQVAQRYEIPASIALTLIHGDVHGLHIFVHKSTRSRFKLLDWEWAGLGVPHTDLATLLRGRGKDTEQAALEEYVSRNGNLSAGDHRLCYEWCQLERGLLTSAYLAGQLLSSHRKPGWAPELIQASALRTLEALEALGTNGR